jgi:hypothetical protein
VSLTLFLHVTEEVVEELLPLGIVVDLVQLQQRVDNVNNEPRPVRGAHAIRDVHRRDGGERKEAARGKSCPRSDRQIS